LLNAAVGFIQEFQAGSIVEELKKTLALKATVLRDGKLQEIEAPEVVPGDILQIEEGKAACDMWPCSPAIHDRPVFCKSSDYYCRGLSCGCRVLRVICTPYTAIIATY
jgi:hypothetical protein